MQKGKEISVLVLILALSVAILGIVKASFVGPSAAPPSGDGVLTASSGKVGIGDTGPDNLLDVHSASAEAALAITSLGTDTDSLIKFELADNTATFSMGIDDSDSDQFKISTTALGTNDRLTIASNGDVTIGQDLTVSGGDITVTKINVNTVDPVYTIDGERYATYVASMVGIKEEVTGLFDIDKEKTIDFRAQEKGSALWLFAKATDLERNFKDMAVILTPSFDGNVWYEKDIENLKLMIHADGSGEISYRLTAPRFDWASWPNILKEGEFSGLIINTGSDGKMIPATEGLGYEN